jgi:hypothetical protein
MDDQFGVSLDTLNRLACNHETALEFMDLYQRILGRLYTEMALVRNCERLVSGEFTAKGQELKVILQKHCQFMGLEWPEKNFSPGGVGGGNLPGPGGINLARSSARKK